MKITATSFIFLSAIAGLAQTVSPTQLTFTYQSGSNNYPPDQTLSVTTSGGSIPIKIADESCYSPPGFSISFNPALDVQGAAGQTPMTLGVHVHPQGWATPQPLPGTYSCEFEVTFLYYYTPIVDQQVVITLIVAAPSTVSVSSSLLSFAYQGGGSLPQAEVITVSASLATAFSVAASGGSWLTVNPASGTTPASLSVSVNPAGLNPGTYNGTITITAPGASNSPQTVSVSLKVTSAPTISVGPGLLSYAYQSGGTLPQAQALMVSGAGAAATFTATPFSSGWLQLSDASSTTPSTGSLSGTTPNTGTFNITVTANPTGLNAGTYNGSIIIAGTGLATGTTIVNVTLAITAPVPAITKVTSAASYATGAVSPGELISIFANASNPIGPIPAVQLSSANCPSPCTNVPTTMGGVQVEFLPSGVYAPLTYVSATQINAVVPYEVQTAGPNLSVEVKYLGQVSSASVLQTVATAPGIITLNGSGTGTAAMLQYDAIGNYQGINSGSNPASPGWVLVMYVTGEGLIPSAATGSVTSTGNVRPLAGPPAVLIDQLPATVLYYGEAGGDVSGVMQINVQIPQGIRTGQADTISFSIGGNTSQNGVTVSVR